MTKIGPLFDSDAEHSVETRFSLSEATRICARLHESGHVAYFAGGCVRDALLGREPKDFDVATDATPDRVREIFGKRKTLAFGASFGVIGVLPAKRPDFDVQPTEVATFRSDGQYSDGRRPDKVHYGDAEHDALRRDFTINGLFFDPADEKVIDFVGGQADLAAGCLRTIGSAEERFEEDKLRMLRAVRFATTLGFELEPQTKAEIIQRAHEIEVVSGERIGAEMRRILVSIHAPRGLELLTECGLDRLIMPDLQLADRQPLIEYLGHRESMQFESSMALVVLVIAKHPSAPAIDALIQWMKKCWRLSGEQTRQIAAAASHWQVIAKADQKKWSEVQPTLIDRDHACVLQVAAAVTAAENMPTEGVALCRQALQRPIQELNPEPLISGAVLQDQGYQPGPEFRHWLQTVRDAQLDGIITTKQAALDQIRKLADQS